jgi:hypothetical protein
MTEDPIPSNQDPFTDCLLGRREYADILTRIIKAENKGFVMGLNNPWGYGKTTFIKMWEKQLQNDGYKTVYFNAWENDFEKNPLIALLSELKPLVPQEGEDGAFREALKKASVMMKKVVPTLAKLAVKFSIGSTDASELVEKISEGYVEILDEEIQDYASKKQGLREFRDALERAIQKITEDKPLIFFIDELDRCRPDYAVELIENVKHLFTVKNIIFVLSIDKEHLACSIKGYYGSENFNTDEYLRRFIDLEYSIPPAKPETLLNFQFAINGVNDFFRRDRSRYSEIYYNELEHLSFTLVNILETNNTTPRRQEHISKLLGLCLKTYDHDSRPSAALLGILIYWKVVSSTDIYNKVQKLEYSIRELQEVFRQTIIYALSDEHATHLIHLEAQLLSIYSNSFRNSRGRDALDIDELVTLSSSLEKTYNVSSLRDFILDHQKHRFYNSITISTLTKRINILNPVR